MGAPSVHPSQRRFSCQVCRKDKSRCQRLNRNDPKCARCTLLGVECTAGQQRNVGRPRRRTTTSAGPGLTVEHPSPAKLHNQPIPASMPRENASLSGGGDLLSWNSTVTPAPTPSPVPVPAVDDATWPAIEMGSFSQPLPLWDLDRTDSLFSPDLGFSITMPTPYSLEALPKTVSAANGTYLTPADNVAMRGPDTIYTSDAMLELFRMNLDLHTRVAAVERNKDTLDFNSVIYRQSVLYIDNSTLAEFMLKTSRDLLLILTKLLNSRESRGRLSYSSLAEAPFPKLVSPSPSQTYPRNHHLPISPVVAAEEPLSAPIALTITSIFTQMVSLYELILEYMTARLERITTDPIAPIPGFTFGGVPLDKPCTQGMLFSEVIVHLLERIERVLGIGPVPLGGEEGLLAARQIQVLWSELDGRREIIPGRGIMRPADLRRLFGKVVDIFRQQH
ncbi:Zn(2)-C6 fungal-type domain-containing protein [Fusarium keratoplasticum]|nr:Zn(2)-C6 fungal-type domain-containing protein [Fusarium keratoplasticum]